MKLLQCSLLALVAAIALSSQLSSCHRIEIWSLVAKDAFNTNLTFDVEPIGNVATLRATFSKAYQVPLDKVQVFCDGTKQRDHVNLDQYHNSSGKLPALGVGVGLVELVKSDGERTLQAAGESDTIADLKKKIEKQDNIPTQLQRLMREDWLLSDSERLASFVLTTDRNTSIRLVVIPARVVVKLPSGELIGFRIEPTEQVSGLKTRIQEDKGIAREQQSLLLEGKGELADDEPVLRSNMMGDPILTLVQRPQGRPTFVRVRLASRKLLTFTINPNETVASLKGKISQAEGIAHANQHLFDVPLKELADTARLSDYITGSESILQLYVCEYGGQDAAHVHVLTPGNDMTSIPLLEITPSDTVASIKSRIQTDASIPQQSHTLHLYFEGRELKDDKPMLEQVINNGSFVNLVKRRIGGPEVVHVNLPSGRVVTFDVPMSSQVSELKNYIERAYETFPVDRQQIFFNNRELINGRLDENNLVSDSTVNLILKPQVKTE